MVREPVLLATIVMVEASLLSEVKEAIVTAPVVLVIEGWFVIDAPPITTASPEAGGVLGEPLTTSQFAAVLHSVLVPPLQRTVP